MSAAYRWWVGVALLCLPPGSPAQDQWPDVNGRWSQNRTDALAAGKAVAPLSVVRLQHGGRVSSIAFAPDGKSLVLAGPGQPLRLWDTASGKELRQFHGHLTGALSVAFSPDGQMLASGGCLGDDTIRIWEAATGKQFRIIEVQKGGVVSLAWSPDGRLLASARGGDIGLWNTTTGAQLREWKRRAAVDVVHFSPCGKYLASGHGDKAVILWDIARGGDIWWQQYHIAPVRSLAFAPDGRTLASGGHGGTIALWEVATGKRRCQWKNSAVSFALAFSPDGRILASADGGTLSLWSLATRRELGRFETNGSQVVAFSPSGKVIAVGDSTAVALLEHTSLPGPDHAGEAKEPFTAKQLETSWHALAEEDAERAHEAIWALVGAPQQALPFLRERLQSVPPPDAQRVRQLLSDLDSDHFAIREKATRELEGMGDSITVMLQRTLDGQPSPEVRRRIEQILEKFRYPHLSAENLRVLRAIEALELIATPEARRVLQTLAAGAPEALATREAAAAVKRLTKRPDGHP